MLTLKEFSIRDGKILGGVTNVGVVGDLFPILENPLRCEECQKRSQMVTMQDEEMEVKE